MGITPVRIGRCAPTRAALMVGMSTFESIHPRDRAGQFTAKANTAPAGALITAVPSAPPPTYAIGQELATRGDLYRRARVDAAAGWQGASTHDREVFTTQHGAVLADELHARTGWRVVAVGDGPDGVVGWVHAGVLTPSGLIADVEGLHEPADWVDRWGDYVDSCGRDELEYDWDSVWAYDAAAFGWTGEGIRFAPDTPVDVARHASRVTEAILSQWDGLW